jgi:hypothetical protein
LLENLNREPEHAGDPLPRPQPRGVPRILRPHQSPSLGWAFTVNHAHRPEGVGGFLDAMDLGRCGEVRVAASHGLRGAPAPRRGLDRLHADVRPHRGRGYRVHSLLFFVPLARMLK